MSNKAMQDEAVAIETSADAEGAVFGRLFRRLMPFLFLLYIMAFVDRANVAFAKTQLCSSLGLSDAAYAFGYGVFFWGYFLFEIPSNLILAKVGPRRWISRIMVTWGLVSLSTMFVQNSSHFTLVRILLGVAEAGFFPGIILYLTYWFPSSQRAKAVAVFMTALPVATVLSGPEAGLLLSLDGRLGLTGWQWMFMCEGAMTMALGVAAWFMLIDRPAKARWLSDAEKSQVERSLEADRRCNPQAEKLTFLRSLGQSRLWLLTLMYFLLMTCLYGVGAWLAPIFKQQSFLAGQSPVTLGLVTAIPYAFAAVVMVLVGRSSDRRGERRWHAAVTTLVGAASMVAANQSGDSFVRMLCLSVAAICIFATLGPFWGLATDYLRGTSAAGGIALINCIGNLGGFFGPTMFSWLKKGSDDFSKSYLLLAGSFAAFAVLAILVGGLARRKQPVELAAE